MGSCSFIGVASTVIPSKGNLIFFMLLRETSTLIEILSVLEKLLSDPTELFITNAPSTYKFAGMYVGESDLILVSFVSTCLFITGVYKLIRFNITRFNFKFFMLLIEELESDIRLSKYTFISVSNFVVSS